MEVMVANTVATVQFFRSKIPRHSVPSWSVSKLICARYAAMCGSTAQMLFPSWPSTSTQSLFDQFNSCLLTLQQTDCTSSPWSFQNPTTEADNIFWQQNEVVPGTSSLYNIAGAMTSPVDATVIWNMNGATAGSAMITAIAASF